MKLLKKIQKKIKKRIRGKRRETKKIKAEKAKILELLQEKKCYLDPDLTLKRFSGLSLIHHNRLSFLFNNHFKMGFNDFINRFRIEEAKKVLTRASKDKVKMVDVVYEVGFSSKSAFNFAFKKFTGLTPSEFKRGKVKPPEKN